LRRPDIQHADYHRPSGLSKVLSALADKRFMVLYQSVTPTDALQGQWNFFVQHIFRAALLLRTYWPTEADAELLNHLDDAISASHRALSCYGLTPHRLELLMDPQWLDDRRAWLNTTRGTMDQDLLNAEAVQRHILLMAEQTPVYCDVIAWGLDTTSGTLVQESILYEWQPAG
jgi:hypothetical protein